MSGSRVIPGLAPELDGNEPNKEMNVSSRDSQGNTTARMVETGRRAPSPSSPLPVGDSGCGSRFWALGDESSDDEEREEAGSSMDLSAVRQPRSATSRPSKRLVPSNASLLDFVEQASVGCAPTAT